MQAFDLDPNLLNAIFRQQNITQETVKDLAQWVHNLDPSFALLKSILLDYFAQNDQQTLLIVAKNIDTLLIGLQQKKCPKSVIRALLAVIKGSGQKVKSVLKIEMVVGKWSSISAQLLQYYLDTFNITIEKQEDKENHKLYQIPIEEYQARIKKQIEKKQYQNAILLIKLVGYPQKSVRLLLEKMANNKDASKAASIIKTHKLDPKLVPQVGERLNKNMVRYFLKTHDWQVSQQIFYDQPEALGCLVQDLIYKKKHRQALSIWWRHEEIANSITKNDCMEFFAQHAQKRKEKVEVQIIKNTLFEDYFGPSNSELYLTLKEMGIEREAVILIQNQPQLIEKFITEINKADVMAIDTESVIGKTKLERKKMEPASIVQIAFQNKIFIIDGMKCRNKQLQLAFLDYIRSGRLVLGHAINNDLDGTLLSLGINQQEVNLVKFLNVIDTCSLFKAIYPKERYSNLAFICKTVLKKEVCKKQTLTNWGRRPLRQNQIHYAAMDAFCVIKIHEALRDQVGEHMLNYFLSKDFD